MEICQWLIANFNEQTKPEEKIQTISEESDSTRRRENRLQQMR